MISKINFLKNLNSSSTTKLPWLNQKWQHLPKQAAMLIPLVKIQNQPHILMISRPKTNISYSGQITFPGGKYDKKFDENVEDTVFRETFEEIGLGKKNLDLWTVLPSTMADYNGDMSVFTFIGEIVDFDFDIDTDLRDKNDNKKIYNCHSQKTKEIFLENFKKFLKIDKQEVDEVILIKVDDLLNNENFKIKYYKHRPEYDVEKMSTGTWKGPVYDIKEAKNVLWGLPAILSGVTMKITKFLIFDFFLYFYVYLNDYIKNCSQILTRNHKRLWITQLYQ